MLLAEQHPESVEDETNDFSDLLQIAEQAADHTQVDRASHEQRVVRAEKYRSGLMMSQRTCRPSLNSWVRRRSVPGWTRRLPDKAVMTNPRTPAARRCATPAIRYGPGWHPEHGPPVPSLNLDTSYYRWCPGFGTSAKARAARRAVQ